MQQPPYILKSILSMPRPQDGNTQFNAIINSYNTHCIDEFSTTIIRNDFIDDISNTVKFVEIDPFKVSYKPKSFEMTLFKRLAFDILLGFHLLRQFIKS